MGTYINPGNAAFREAVNYRIYIDKSKLITYTNSVLNTTQKNICVSRPRRFGKSMSADMLVAYYSKGCDSAGLFAGRKVEREDGFKLHLNRHQVLRLDVQQFLESRCDLDTFISQIEHAVLEELIEEKTGINTMTAEDPMTAVAIGTGKFIEFLSDGTVD